MNFREQLSISGSYKYLLKIYQLLLINFYQTIWKHKLYEKWDSDQENNIFILFFNFFTHFHLEKYSVS